MLPLATSSEGHSFQQSCVNEICPDQLQVLTITPLLVHSCEVSLASLLASSLLAIEHFPAAIAVHVYQNGYRGAPSPNPTNAHVRLSTVPAHIGNATREMGYGPFAQSTPALILFAIEPVATPLLSRCQCAELGVFGRLAVARTILQHVRETRISR